jgi:hypothetical protein
VEVGEKPKQPLKPSRCVCHITRLKPCPSFLSTCENLLPFTPCPNNRDDMILCGQAFFKAINRVANLDNSVLKSNRSHFALPLYAVVYGGQRLAHVEAPVRRFAVPAD